MTARTIDIDVVLAGPGGTAARIDLTAAPPPFAGAIIDDWTITAGGQTVWLIVVRIPTGDYVLTLSHQVDGRPVEFLLSEPLPGVTTGRQARDAGLHLARAVIDGALPAMPITREDLAAWQACLRGVAKIAASTWPAGTDRPKGR